MFASVVFAKMILAIARGCAAMGTAAMLSVVGPMFCLAWSFAQFRQTGKKVVRASRSFGAEAQR
eukprot:7786754-Lingulodinium_polyedra.AAC.1